jgi:toxin ParE1/3/4
MPQLKLRYTISAQTDLSEIFVYLEGRDKQAAKRVINTIERSAKILATHPLTGRQTDFSNIRVKPIPNYPYLLFYQASGNDLTILRILHSARDWPEML